MPRKKGRLRAGAAATSTAEDAPPAPSEPPAQPPAEPPKKPRKREFRVTDPLDFAPCDYNKALFKCNYPLVHITHTMPPSDKFGGLRMKEATLNKALDLLLLPSYKISRGRNIKGELGGRSLHCALFDNLILLTKPSEVSTDRDLGLERNFEYLYPASKRRKVTPTRIAELLAKAQRASSNPETEALANHDCVLSEGEEWERQGRLDAELGSDKSCKVEEETSPDAGDVPGKERVDVKIFVSNNSNKILKKKFGQVDDLEPRKCVCICECKWDVEVDADALMQAAAYACQQALSNLVNLHFTPIYILALTRTQWTYGVLDCRGCIVVKDGHIDRGSLHDFSQQESVRFSKDPLSACDLELQLENATKYYQRYYTKMPNAVYPNRTFLVGNLHVSTKWFQLPIYKVVNGLVNEHVSLFYEGLLRIVIGDKVNDWEVEDLVAARDLREALTQTCYRMLRAGRLVDEADSKII